MPEHYLVTVDQRCLRIFSKGDGRQAALGRVETFDCGAHLASQSAVDCRDHILGATEIAGRAAGKLNAFLERHPEATWDFSADGELYVSVLARITRSLKRRLRDCAVRGSVGGSPGYAGTSRACST